MTKEASPLSVSRISSRIPNRVSRSSTSAQLSASTSAVHSTTPSQALPTLPPAVRGGGFVDDLLQRELVGRSFRVGRPGRDYLGDGAHPVTRAQVHHPHPLGGATLAGDRLGVYPDRGPNVRDDHQFVQVRPHDPYTSEAAPVFAGLHRDDALAAAPLRAELGEGGALAEAPLRYHEQVRRRGAAGGDHVHRQYVVALLERDPLDTGGRPSPPPCVGLGGTD